VRQIGRQDRPAAPIVAAAELFWLTAVRDRFAAFASRLARDPDQLDRRPQSPGSIAPRPHARLARPSARAAFAGRIRA
jgi:hypothetical protein